jgi:hypothetical protein
MTYTNSVTSYQYEHFQVFCDAVKNTLAKECKTFTVGNFRALNANILDLQILMFKFIMKT